MYKFRKRGISPLIATVLIIGFTVALAAVIMTWGQGFTKSMQQSADETTNVQLTCAQDVQVEVASVCWQPLVVPAKCTVLANGCLKVTVENNGNKDLKSITARIKQSESVIAVKSGLPALPAFGLKVYDIDMAPLTPVIPGTAVTQVKLIPVVDIGGKEVTCAESIPEFGNVGVPVVVCPP